MLQTRIGKRNGAAAIRIAMDMLDEGLISEKEALLRITTDNINEISCGANDQRTFSSDLILPIFKRLL